LREYRKGLLAETSSLVAYLESADGTDINWKLATEIQSALLSQGCQARMAPALICLVDKRAFFPSFGSMEDFFFSGLLRI
jgi:hypothetical protein